MNKLRYFLVTFKKPWVCDDKTIVTEGVQVLSRNEHLRKDDYSNYEEITEEKAIELCGEEAILGRK